MASARVQAISSVSASAPQAKVPHTPTRSCQPGAGQADRAAVGGPTAGVRRGAAASATAASSRLTTAVQRLVASSPSSRVSHSPASSVPATAPSVLTPYSSPTARWVSRRVWTSARVSTGSVPPIKKVAGNMANRPSAALSRSPPDPPTATNSPSTASRIQGASRP